jgi:HEAT repeats
LALITLAPFDSTDKIELDAGFLTINSVTSQNGTPLRFDYDSGDKNDNLKVTLDRVCRSGEDVTVKINYHSNWVNKTDPNNLGGSNGKGIRFFEPTSDDPNQQAASSTWPVFTMWMRGRKSRERWQLTCDQATIAMLLTAIGNDKSWNRAAAINFLGMTQDAKFADLYLNILNDESDRTINAAAIALGKSKSPKAFDALAKLANRASWKNQSLISALAGLRQLGDPRGFDIAFKALSDTRLLRWRLPTPCAT